VLGVRFDSSDLTEVTAYGTAVIVRPV